MKKSYTILAALLAAFALMIMAGCATGTGQGSAKPATPAVKAAPKADAPAFKAWKQTVDTKYVRYIVDGKIKGYLIDSRPGKAKYDKGHIPGAVSLPTSQFDKKKGLLPADKSTPLVFYCGGLKCALSHKAAYKAKALGYKNIKVYAKGFPAWKKAYGPGSQAIKKPQPPMPSGQTDKAFSRFPVIVEASYVKSVTDGAPLGLVIDSRPKKAKYDKGHIPGSISLPASKFGKMKGLLPADKNALLIFYCGGLKCPLSHKSAFAAAKLGYKNIAVYSKGYPDWKKAYGAGVAQAAAKAAQKGQALKYKSGPGEGTIDLAVFKNLIKTAPASIMLVDMRDAGEFKQGHFKGAVNIPTDELEKKLPKMKVDKPLIFVCSTGARSGEAYYMVKDLRPDIKEVYFVEAEMEYKKDGSYKMSPPK